MRVAVETACKLPEPRLGTHYLVYLSLHMVYGLFNIDRLQELVEEQNSLNSLPWRRKKRGASSTERVPNSPTDPQYSLLSTVLELLRENFGNDYEKVAKFLLFEVDKLSSSRRGLAAISTTLAVQ